MTDADRTEKPPPPAGDENDQPKRLPKVTLNTPPTQEDIPQLLSTLKLFRHQFSPRERHCLGKHPVLGPLYEGVQGKCGQFIDKPRRFAVCSSRQLCPKEQSQLLACIRATRDASMCHEFRDEVERCGVKMSQRLLRAALSDDWF
ncbi:unnamed protein product [Ectocarpus sp. 8 AP-2014]